MEESLFVPLREKQLTTLKIRHDWRTERVILYAAKDWDPDLDFSRYNQDFYANHLLTNQAIYYNHSQVLDLFDEYNLIGYLNRVLALIKNGRHLGIDCYYNRKYNIRFMGNLHSLVRGINNRKYATAAGGIRRHSFQDCEIDVIQDGLNLGRAMSYKNIAAEVPYGGCKTTVHMDELDLENMEIMGFLAFCLDSFRCCTGPDMNFPTEMADVMNRDFSVQFTGGPKGPLGETGLPTAYGNYLALKQAQNFCNGSDSLDGLTIAVQGLGAVGWYMCEYLLQENVKLIVADIDPTVVQKLISAYPGRPIQAVAPDQIVTVQADIFCPCAIGGVIHDGNIPKLKFRTIFGPANNQLRAGSNEDEIRLAKLLAQRGILYQEAWWHNTGGVLCGIEEFENGPQASRERLMHKIEQIIPVKTWQNLNKARDLGITPTECMYLTCNELIYGKV